MSSKITTDLIPDDPLVMDANYVLDAADRRKIDDQILGCEAHLADSLLAGYIATWRVVDAASASIVVGDCICSKGTYVTKAVAAALADSGKVLGVAVSAGGPGAKIRVALQGLLSPLVTGLEVGDQQPVICDTDTGRLTRVATVEEDDHGMGQADVFGSVTLGVTPSVSSAVETPDATTSIKGKVRLGGDIADGTANDPIVTGIQGRSVSASGPANQDVYRWNEDSSEWQPGAVVATEVTTGGDISGQSDDVTVEKIHGATVPVMGTALQVLRVNAGETALEYADPSGGVETITQLSGFVTHGHVAQFGAVGDGVTDDTAAIQACIDACDVIYFGGKSPTVAYEHKVYKITSSLEIINDGTLGYGKKLIGENHASFGNNLGCRIAWGGSTHMAAATLTFANVALKTMTTATLSFLEVGGTGDTITRATGDFTSDGFVVGDIITVTGSVSNNIVAAPIVELTATVITLGSTDLVTEAGVIGCTLTAIGDTITRSSGSFLTEGFAPTDTVTVKLSASNNIKGTLAGVTADRLTFVSTVSLTNEGPVAGCTVVGFKQNVAMLTMYTAETVIEGICFTMLPGNPVQSAVRSTQGTSPTVMTENIFRHCYFGSVDVTTTMDFGVVIGDNYEFPSAPSWPLQCDFNRFHDCTFKYLDYYGVYNPNESAQSVSHTFDICRFGGMIDAYHGYITNCVMRHCAFGQLSGAIVSIANYTYETHIMGGSCESVVALATSAPGNLAGFTATLKISDHRFFMDTISHPPGTRFISVAFGGPLLIDGLDCSGQYIPYTYIYVENQSNNEACPIIATGCSFPWEAPFLLPASPKGHHRVVLGCNYPDSITTVTKRYDDEIISVNPDAALKQLHRFDSVCDAYGNKVLGRQQAAIADLPGGGVLADSEAKINEILAALNAHGLLSSFVPTDIGSTLKAWYEAGTSFAVGQWDDLSGNGHHLVQATGANQFSQNATDAAYNNRATLNMGASDYMTCAGWTQAQPLTLWFVGEVANDPGIIVAGGTAPTIGFGFVSGSPALGAGGPNILTNGGVMTTKKMWCEIYDSYSSAMIRDDVEEGQLPQALEIGTAGIVNGIVVGANNGFSQNCGGKIAELLIFSGHQPLRQRQLVASYLAAKYGITIP